MARVPVSEHRYVGLDRDTYGPEVTRRTYAGTRRRALDLLAGGRSVILDGGYHSASFRQEAFSVVRRPGVPVFSRPVRHLRPGGQRAAGGPHEGTLFQMLKKFYGARPREERLG